MKLKNLGKTYTLPSGQLIRRGEFFEGTLEEIPRAFRDLIVPADSLAPEPAGRFKHRRHPIGEFWEYDDAFERRLASSSILSRTGSIMNSAPLQMASLAGLQGLLAELEAQVQGVAGLLEKIDVEFQNRKIQARRQGKVEPETMPPELLVEKLRAEGRHDVLLEEVDKIRGLIAAKEAPEKAAEEAAVLRHGPTGGGKGDPLRVIDGQDVICDRKGNLRISCKKSPYDGMLVVDYRVHVCEPFRQKMARLVEEERKPDPNRPLRCVVAWEDLPPRPKGF